VKASFTASDAVKEAFTTSDHGLPAEQRLGDVEVVGGTAEVQRSATATR